MLVDPKLFQLSEHVPFKNLFDVPPLNYTQSFALENTGHSSAMFGKKPFKNGRAVAYLP